MFSFNMGCICFENPSMGVYFIEAPDGYWLEIIPERKTTEADYDT